MLYEEWARLHPEAANDLTRVFAVSTTRQPSMSESAVQQRIRVDVAKRGASLWRNNVGAVPTKLAATCPGCGLKHWVEQKPLRYGLVNESTEMNKHFKSSDLIGIVPRLITPVMVGQTIGQFAAIECKKSDWQYTGKGRETAQAAFIALVNKLGGYGTFSNGEVLL